MMGDQGASLKDRFAGGFIVKIFPFFYGYVVLVVCTVGKILTAPGQSPCIGVVINSIVDDIGISLTTVTGLYLVATTTSAIALSRMGKVIDRVGVRIMVTVIALLLGVACFVASVARNVGVLLLAFFLLRFFGQGSLMMVSKTTINYWWVDLRGTMMGIAGALVSLGMTGVFPVVLNLGIEAVGWRQTYFILGLNSIFFMAPLGFLFYRNEPENFGLLPDGKEPKLEDKGVCSEESHKEVESEFSEAGDSDHKRDGGNIDVTAKEAFKTGAFWSNALSLGLIAATATAFWFHLKGIMIDNNIDKTMMQSIYPVLAVSSVIGRLISGRMIDTYGKKGFLVLVYGLIMQAIAMLLVLSVQFSKYMLVLVCFVQALGSAFVMNVASVVFANNFGRKYLGEIQGLADSLGVLGSAIGPFPFGLVRDQTGSYNMAFFVGSFLPLITSLWVYWSSSGRLRMREQAYLELERL